ncbi:vanin-like protein 1 isoform X2 [Ostrinia furnacalis]|uniref:vanin-like protein 1 isoform X1 n=1 Tax=Ostrinia furnacalis TaxID=93504 RepID=UPI00103C534D|nr:vanin-like protein 1 isoform X1 [Ostrinia furnacalis]XP_028164691.1 vanin-like protein 1 isoform X2 [Ostrinia furnacalis]
MNFSFGFIFLCVGVALASEETYRAGVVTTHGDVNSYVPLIHEAGKLNVDILVLPSPQAPLSSMERTCEMDNYDVLVETISSAAKQAGLYVVAHLIEKTRCQNKNELVRSNLVFDREGNVVSVYRKPLTTVANCTIAPTNIGTFSTDFGVQFGLLMEEDLVLRKAEELDNFVVLGAWSSEVPFLSESQFASSWAFSNNVNLVSSSGIFAGSSGSEARTHSNVQISDLDKLGNKNQQIVPPVVNSLELKSSPAEDLSQYIIRPLDVAASAQGYKETVCHDGFCCEFYVKMAFDGPKEEVNYGLAAFNGVRHFDHTHNIGSQTCAVFACAGLYKRSCSLGSQNSTNVKFQKISITANFTETIQYPIILTTGSKIEPKAFKMAANSKQVTLEVTNADNLLTFGIFGRDFSKDSKNFVLNDSGSIYDTINEEMTELFDYLWIRLRVVLIIASIYVLEML